MNHDVNLDVANLLQNVRHHQIPAVNTETIVSIAASMVGLNKEPNHCLHLMDSSMATDIDATIHIKSLLSASDDEHQLTGSNALDISQIIDDNGHSD